MKQWFKSIPNDAFTPAFKDYIRKIVAVTEGSYSAEYFVDLLRDELINEFTLSRYSRRSRSLQLTLLAAACHDLLSNDDSIDQLIPERLYTFTRVAGMSALWQPMEVHDVEIKSKLYMSLYQRLSADNLECCLYLDDTQRDSVYTPPMVGRQVRLSAMSVAGAALSDDETAVPKYINECCTTQFLLSTSPSKPWKVRSFLSQLEDDFLHTTITFGTPYDYQGLIEHWICELCRNALVLGCVPEQIIDGAKVIISAYSDYLLNKKDSSNAIGHQGLDLTVAAFERQVLINALSPFPHAVALLNPAKRDFFPETLELSTTGVCVAGPGVIHDREEGASNYSVISMLSTMKALGLDFRCDDIRQDHDDSYLVISEYLKDMGGYSPDAEQWLVKNIKKLSVIKLRRLLSSFNLEGMSDETLLHIHKYRAHLFIQIPEYMQKVSLKVPYRKGQEERVVDILIEHGVCNLRAIENLSIGTRALKSRAMSLDYNVRKHLLGEDLGL